MEIFDDIKYNYSLFENAVLVSAFVGIKFFETLGIY